MQRSPARFLPAFLTLVTLAFAIFAAGSVRTLMAIDSSATTGNASAAPRAAVDGDAGTDAIAAGLASLARETAALGERRAAASQRITTLGIGFFASLCLLVFSFVSAERASRRMLAMARAARLDADRSRAQLVEAVENINEGFVLYDNDDRLVICNRKFREAYKIVADLLRSGVTSEQILRAATERGQFPQAGDDREGWIARRLEQRRRFAPPFEQQLAGGRWHMVSDRSTRDGGLVGIRTDITELKRRESELREARLGLEEQAERTRVLAEEARAAKDVLQDAIESINEGFCLFDADDRLVMCNSRYRDLHQRAAGAIRPGASFAEITRAAIESGHLIVAEEAGHAIAEREHARRNLEDSSVEEQFDDDRWIRVSTRRMRNGGIVSVFADITEMKRREFALTSAHARLERQTREMSDLAETAHRANRAKSEFLAMMSHEIRTPLNGVISALNLVGDGASTGEDRELVATARSGARSLLSILNDILDMSKIEAGMITLECRPFGVRDLVANVVALCRAEADARGLSIGFDIRADVPEFVRGDASRVRQMVLNYVTNAIKFTDRGGVEIHVARAAGQDSLRFEVVDTGIGIPGDKHGQVFRDFVQLDQSIRRRHGGTGLGLAITRRLARVMNGAVGFASEAGRGSTFWFEAPLPAASAPAADELPPRPLAGAAAATFAGLRVLLAEDNETNCYLAHLMLERMGCEVDDVRDGAAAVHAISASAYDLVLMDISMPVMDGLEATRLMKASGSSVPVIALSANTGPEFEAACLRAGMKGCLTKPIDIDALREALASIADESRPRPRRREETPREPARDGLFDPGQLDRVYEDLGPRAFERIVAGCLADIEGELGALREAWSAGPGQPDAGAARRAAHKLVSLASTVGARELSRLSRLAEEGNLGDAERETFDSVATLSVRLLTECAARMASRAGGNDAARAA